MVDNRNRLDESLHTDLDNMSPTIKSQLFVKNITTWQYFSRFWRPHLEKGKACFRALEGKTFTDDERMDMEDIGKIPIEVPVILPKMNILSGFQRSSRRDGVVVGQTSEDSASTEVVNILLRSIRQQNNLDQERSKLFQDGMVTGMPSFMWIDYDTTGEGDKDLCVTAEAWNAVLPSPNFTKLDLSDCNEIIRNRVMDVNQLIQAYPAREEDILANTYGYLDEDDKNFTSSQRDEIMQNVQESIDGYQTSGLYTVIERNFFILKVRDVYIASHSQEPEILPESWSPVAKAKWEQANPEYVKVRRKVRTLWVTTVTTTGLVLENKEHWFQEKCFPCAMFVPMMMNNEPRGWVEFLIPQQRMHNVGRTEYIHSARFANDKVIFTKQGTFADPELAMAEKSRTGGVVEVSEDADVHNDIRIVADQGGNQGMLEMSNVATNDLDLVSAINPAMAGMQESANETASGYSRRVSQAQTAQGPYIDNFMLFDSEIHKTILKAIPFVYDEQRVLRYLKDDNTAGEIEINKVVERDPYTYAVTKVVNRLDASRYDYMQAVGDNSVTGKENEFGAFLRISQEVLSKLPPEEWAPALKVIPNRYAKDMAEGIELRQQQKQEQEMQMVQQRQAFEARNDNVQEQARTNVNVNLKGEDLETPIAQAILTEKKVLPSQEQAPQGEAPGQGGQEEIPRELLQALGA